MKPLSKYSSRGSAVQELKISSLRLVRNAACKYDHEERPEFRNRGRKVCFTIEIKKFAGNSGIVERDLSGIEALLSQAGWKNDTCPLYDEGISCGFWIHPDEVEYFRAAYKACKAALPKYLADIEASKEEPGCAAREPDDLLPITADGTLPVDVVTLRTNNAEDPMEFAIVENQVFVRTVKRLTQDDYYYYVGANIRADARNPEIFVHVPSYLLFPGFFEANRVAFDELEMRCVTLEPDRVFQFDGTPGNYQAALLGLAHQRKAVRG